MNEQKQIEELAKVIGDTWLVDLEGEIKDVCEVLDEVDIEGIARELYEQGYRKLPEDSVVLSREEYEKLRETISDLRYDKFDLKNEISEKDNKIALLEGTIDCIKFNVGFTRKETAEKILNSLLFEVKALDDYESVGKFDILGWLEELANKYGVEIEK